MTLRGYVSLTNWVSLFFYKVSGLSGLRKVL